MRDAGANAGIGGAGDVVENVRTAVSSLNTLVLCVRHLGLIKDLM